MIPINREIENLFFTGFKPIHLQKPVRNYCLEILLVEGVLGFKCRSCLLHVIAA